MSSGGAIPPALNAPFNHFGYLFPAPAHFFPPSQQRIKMKRQRQRVDAGEPRNSYQQQRVPPPPPPATKHESLQHTTQATATPLNVSEFLPTLAWMAQQQTTESAENKKKEGNTDKNETNAAPEEEPANGMQSEENEGDEGVEDAPVSTASGADSTASSNSSSSRRKSFLPQKTSTAILQAAVDELLEADQEWTTKEENEEDGEEGNEGMSALQAQLNASPNKINDILEAHKKFYSNMVEQQKKSVDADRSNNKDLAFLAASLKQEILNSVTMSIDKTINDWLSSDPSKCDSDKPRAIFPSMPPLYPYQTAGNQVANPFGLGTGSIFPPPFNPFMGALNTQRKDDDSRKRRKLETPSVRSKMARSPGDRDDTPASERASPLLPRGTPLSSYFPASMVGHPLYDTGRFDGAESPIDSDDVSDCGPYDPNIPQSSLLTPIHLRKAKLMFFYTRYPNSSLLKQYFPDIRFNKNNTAQLVKWFSNFREYYYNQMDKYAKQAVAEGIRRREDITVTKDSEIFKQLNQHYNRNNHIEAPEKLVWVIQETLREFYEAITQGRHNEPSWKKQIYKVICRLDEPIPDYFKDPNFLDRLDA